jgi:hypothetical protein
LHLWPAAHEQQELLPNRSYSAVMSSLLEGAKPRAFIVSKHGFRLKNSGRHGQETSWSGEHFVSQKNPLAPAMRTALLGLLRDGRPVSNASTRKALELRGLIDANGVMTCAGRICGMSSMSLEEQCCELGLPLRQVSTGDFRAPEKHALNLAREEGWQGAPYEGTTLLFLLKSVLFPTLVCLFRSKLPLWSAEEIVDLVARGYYEGLVSKLKDPEVRLLAEGVFCATEDTIRLGFERCKSASLDLAVAHQDLTLDLILNLYNSLGTDTLFGLVLLLQSDPYKYRKGWPDLTLVRGGEVLFAEVKTSDRLHESQLETIPYVSRVLGKDRFAVWRLVNVSHR